MAVLMLIESLQLLVETDFTQTNFAHSIKNASEDDIMKWVSMAGGLHKLKPLIHGLSRNYGVPVPDDFWAKVHNASKRWTTARGHRMIKNVVK